MSHFKPLRMLFARWLTQGGMTPAMSGCFRWLAVSGPELKRGKTILCKSACDRFNCGQRLACDNLTRATDDSFFSIICHVESCAKVGCVLYRKKKLNHETAVILFAWIHAWTRCHRWWICVCGSKVSKSLRSQILRNRQKKKYGMKKTLWFVRVTVYFRFNERVAYGLALERIASDVLLCIQKKRVVGCVPRVNGWENSSERKCHVQNAINQNSNIMTLGGLRSIRFQAAADSTTCSGWCRTHWVNVCGNRTLACVGWNRESMLM